MAGMSHHPVQYEESRRLASLAHASNNSESRHADWYRNRSPCYCTVWVRNQSRSSIDKKSVEQLRIRQCEKFDEFFDVRKNVIEARFNSIQLQLQRILWSYKLSELQLNEFKYVHTALSEPSSWNSRDFSRIPGALTLLHSPWSRQSCIQHQDAVWFEQCWNIYTNERWHCVDAFSDRVSVWDVTKVCISSRSNLCSV